ncbi:MAG: hypothetical protein JSW39_04565 [Desulfobacterales bacterium]|nr:MAG: hypothetical protein JSW39_04565 [Desulfobacterales bacterium]
MNNSPLIDLTASAARFPPGPEPGDEFAAGGRRREPTATEKPAEWRLATFAGRFGEVSGDPAGASLTLVFRLVLEVQQLGEPVAWITRRQSTFFPPDAADAGIDLAALPVVRAADVLAAARAAEYLLRSGAFGLVMMDLGANAHLPLQAQARLAAQARQHDTALICMTEKEGHRPSLGSLVSLRAHAAQTQREAGWFRCEVCVLKDKRRGPGWTHAEVCRGPDGLR